MNFCNAVFSCGECPSWIKKGHGKRRDRCSPHSDTKAIRPRRPFRPKPTARHPAAKVPIRPRTTGKSVTDLPVGACYRSLVIQRAWTPNGGSVRSTSQRDSLPRLAARHSRGRSRRARGAAGVAGGRIYQRRVTPMVPQPTSAAFAKAPKRSQYVEGQNVTVEYHWLEGHCDYCLRR